MDSAPGAATIVSILRTTIHNLEAEGCIENGQFCSLSRLDAFARETVPDLRALSSAELDKSSQPMIAAMLGLGPPKSRFVKSSSAKLLDTDVQLVLNDVLFRLCGSDIAEALVVDTERSTIVSKYPSLPDPEAREFAVIERISRYITELRDSDSELLAQLSTLKSKCDRLLHENLELHERCDQAEAAYTQIKSDHEILRQQAQSRQPAVMRLDAEKQASAQLMRQFDQEMSEIRRDVKIILKKIGAKEEDLIGSIAYWVLISVIGSILVLLMSILAKHVF
jgi:hypothetical protein